MIGHYQLYAGLLPNIVSGFGEAWQRFNNNMLLSISICGVASYVARSKIHTVW